MNGDDFKGRFSLESTRSEAPIASGYRWYTLSIEGFGQVVSTITSCLPFGGVGLWWSIGSELASLWTLLRSYPPLIMYQLISYFPISHPTLSIISNMGGLFHSWWQRTFLFLITFIQLLLLYCRSFPWLWLPIFLHHFCCFYFLVARNAQETEWRNEPRDRRQYTRN